MTLKDMPLKKVSQRSTLRSLLLLPSARDSHKNAFVPIGGPSVDFSSAGTEWGLACCPAPSRRNQLKIKLKHGRNFGHCDFLGATDDALTCDFAGFLQDVHPQYSRDNIKAVYLVHNARAIGFGIGAGAGAVIGAAATHGPLVNHELFAVLDAGILGGVGYFLGMVFDPFFHGKAVYVDSNPRPVRPPHGLDLLLPGGPNISAR